MSEKKLVGYIDITPTWSEHVEVLLALLQDGDSEGKRAAQDEIRRMAKIADAYVDSQKKESA